MTSFMTVKLTLHDHNQQKNKIEELTTLKLQTCKRLICMLESIAHEDFHVQTTSITRENIVYASCDTWDYQHTTIRYYHKLE